MLEPIYCFNSDLALASLPIFVLAPIFGGAIGGMAPLGPLCVCHCLQCVKQDVKLCYYTRLNLTGPRVHHAHLVNLLIAVHTGCISC